MTDTQSTEQTEVQEQPKPAAAEQPDQKADAPEGAAEENAVDDASETRDRDEKGRFAKRIDSLTRKAREAERNASLLEAERDYYKALAGGGEKPNQAQDSTAPVATDKPKQDDFDSYDDYIEALTDWKTDQKFEAERQRRSQAEERQTLEQQWSQSVSKAKADLPDYEQVMADSADLEVATHVVQAIMQAPDGAALAYQLAKQPEALERLNKMSPIQAAMELGRIGAPPPPQQRRSNAPAPVNPVKSGSATTKSLYDMGMDDFIASRKRGVDIK